MHHDRLRGGRRLRQHRADGDAGADRRHGFPGVVALVAIGDHHAAVAADGRGAFFADDDRAAAADRCALDVDFLAGDDVAVPADRGIAFFAADDRTAPARRGIAFFALDGRAPRSGGHGTVVALGDGAAPSRAHLRRRRRQADSRRPAR